MGSIANLQKKNQLTIHVTDAGGGDGGDDGCSDGGMDVNAGTCTCASVRICAL